jgi:tagaturonate reductase
MMKEFPERVLQFGTGRFIRAFADYFIHRANAAGMFHGSIVCIQSTGAERADALNAQDGRFHLWTRGVEAGETRDTIEEITSISRVIPAGLAWNQALDCARNPDIDLIVSNASEIAVVFDEDDRRDADPPRSFPGKLTAVLYARATAFSFAEDAGVVILPCELVEANGDALREIVLQLASAWSLGPEFLEWVRSCVLFCNTLVDRIVTGRPPANHLAEARERIGHDDPMLAVTEPYRLWAIEGNTTLRARLGFVQADEGIVVEEDITPYRERKIRLLNGGHTLTVPLGMLYGNATVLDNMRHPLTGRFIEALLREEIGPTLPVEPDTVEPYIKQVLDRWNNPFLEHQLADIAWQSTSKMRHRVVPTILRYYRQFSHAPPHLARGFAAFLVLARPGFEIDDDRIDPIRAAWATRASDDPVTIRGLVDTVCSDEDLWGFDLSRLEGFSEAVADNVSQLIGRAG